MVMSQLNVAMVAASLLSIVLATLPAGAEPLKEANQLLPLETRNLVIESDPSIYDSAADRINTRSSGETATGATSGIGAGLLEGLIDDDGDLRLPLGLTVFDAMGATSVGFGSDF